MCYLIFADARGPSFEDLSGCSRDELRSIYRSLIQNVHGGKIPNCADKKMCPKWMPIELWNPVERLTPDELRRAIGMASKFQLSTSSVEHAKPTEPTHDLSAETRRAPPHDEASYSPSPKLDLKLMKPRASKRLARKTRCLPTRSCRNTTTASKRKNAAAKSSEEKLGGVDTGATLNTKHTSVVECKFEAPISIDLVAEKNKRARADNTDTDTTEHVSIECAKDVSKSPQISSTDATIDTHQPANCGTRRSILL
mmetsp:Transcript_2302/g.4375  ORF Transcript_2302/g.4375 Transcript_2302/m.4375 type:complete len:254 (+) Transcript_2302:414-1175(+)